MQDKNELIVHVAASYNHSLAVSKNGKVFTWGFSGKGVLGRQRKIEEYLPIETGFSP
jgi:alpha-tubulin suppressor-like RCC1 family protein